MTTRIEGYNLGQLHQIDSAAWGHTTIVQMLNGQVIELAPGRISYIPTSDGSSAFNINLDYLEKLTPLTNFTFRIIITTLKTYSQDYSREITNAIRSAFVNGTFQIERQIVLEDIRRWSSNTSVSYWPFLKFYLYQLSRIRSQNLIDDEVRTFLEAPDQFEEKAKGAYFALLTNDHDLGALTEQELKNGAVASCVEIRVARSPA